jgi:cyclopropane fatty-acyl-phospholipid synthase-like methyltransferase
MLDLLDLHSGARLLYAGCGWGEVVLAWAQAWASASRPDEEAPPA